ncbi:hypothetical protein AVEN_238834-1 [Araneus ventricosus]|uniref:Uncharacterized protein n=1 Tax=Araneus ventricosus TaxID=182803 RepID=A0A4Y2LJV3_ARAVE|nr:hypothetical protein AVEN_238834-1 [Araneus ventricosus]
MLSFHSPYCITPKCKLHSSTQAATPKPNANAGAPTTTPEITCQDLNDFRETAENFLPGVSDQARSCTPLQKGGNKRGQISHLTKLLVRTSVKS